MPRCIVRGAWVLVVLPVGLTGCGWFGSDDSDEIDVLSEADGGGEPVLVKPEPKKKDRLELKLKVGDEFPLLKTVEQSLSQDADDGPVVGQSKLQLLLSISVEEVRQGKKRLGVRYHRVHYEHDVAGSRVVYDSDAPPPIIPAEAQVYHGLVGNTFSFWIGPDNLVIELVGFDDFLARCVRDVPASQRQVVLARLAEISGEEGIANFVDDSIGLLPYSVDGQKDGAAVEVGANWLREREVTRPIPLLVRHSCTLKELTDTIAEIDIAGGMAPSAAQTPPDQANRGVSVTVRGGRTLGNCRIDRETGLPIYSRIEHNLDMTVRTAEGDEFEQQKRIVTTVRAFPQQGASAVAESPAPDRSAQSASGHPLSVDRLSGIVRETQRQ